MLRNRSIFPLQVLRMLMVWKRFVFAVIPFSGILFLHSVLHGQTQPPLTLDQVQSLLRIGAPDSTIANAIESRGVAFSLSGPILNELEREGAGVQTLTTLHKLVPTETIGVGAAHSTGVERAPPANDLSNEQLSTLAAVSFSKQNWGEFEANSREALRHGGSVSIRMMEEHNHKGWTGESIEPVELTITPTNLIVKSVSHGDETTAITASLSTIGTIEVTDKSTAGKGIVFIVRHLTPGTYLLHVDLQKGKRADDRTQLYFTTTDSQIVKAQGGVNYLASPANSRKMLQAVADVIGIGVGISKSNTQ